MPLSPQGTSSTRCLPRCTAATRPPTAARAVRRCSSGPPTTGTSAGRELCLASFCASCCSDVLSPPPPPYAVQTAFSFLEGNRFIFSSSQKKKKKIHKLKNKTNQNQNKPNKTKPQTKPKTKPHPPNPKKPPKPKKAPQNKTKQTTNPQKVPQNQKRRRPLRPGPRRVSELARAASPSRAGVGGGCRRRSALAEHPPPGSGIPLPARGSRSPAAGAGRLWASGEPGCPASSEHACPGARRCEGFGICPGALIRAGGDGRRSCPGAAQRSLAQTRSGAIPSLPEAGAVPPPPPYTRALRLGSGCRAEPARSGDRIRPARRSLVGAAPAPAPSARCRRWESPPRLFPEAGKMWERSLVSSSDGREWGRQLKLGSVQGLRLADQEPFRWLPGATGTGLQGG